MKKRALILSLLTTALISPASGFIKTFNRLRKTQTVKDRKLEIFPVKKSNSSCKSCIKYDGALFSPLTSRPVVTLEDFEFNTFSDNGGGLKISIAESAGKKLDLLSSKFSNSKLAIIYDGKVLALPTLKVNKHNENFKFVLANPLKFEKMLDTLEG